ncbi:hypothetical protein ACJIZ3_003916 [Penstemon smallii]|uniref:Uncharacterized protein n=1 Tax=Penstemon smallii TaxID=265156 RepID=A0ABD3S0M7_9LAMI
MSDNNSGSENEDDRILGDQERGRNRHVNRVIFPTAATLILPSHDITPTPAPGQTHVRRTRPMPQPEWWTPPPPPSFPATDLPPSSSSSTPIGIFSIFHS